MNATIRWVENDRGEGRLMAIYDNGHCEFMPCDEPISARSDSWSIAQQFGDALTVDHDGEAIHATYADGPAAPDYGAADKQLDECGHTPANR